MNKFWTLLLASSMVLGLCGCQRNVEESPIKDGMAQTEGTGVQVVQTGSGVTVKTAQEWAADYPEIYESYLANSENTEVHDYTKDYPMVSILYEGIGFAKSYGSARGHTYTVEDVTSTGRPHALANCFSCKTPDFTAMVNEVGLKAYYAPFESTLAKINEPVSCYNCHANTGDELVITHTYLADALGSDLDKIDPATLSCAQCHVEYYFTPGGSVTTLPYQGLDTMTPDAILDFYNHKTMIEDGFSAAYADPSQTQNLDQPMGRQVFADYTNPRTGVRQIKVQHPEFETYMGAGSVHADTFSCADCHMGEATAADGTTYTNHKWTSPLSNDTLQTGTCAQCHSDLKGHVLAIQEEIEGRTNDIGNELAALTEKLAAAVESDTYTEEELNAIRTVVRDAQFYWDFVFAENSEGAHNSTLANDCLDKAEALLNQAMGLFKQ